ncbi:hypothetical protein [Streptomyces albipurpureus]|uniref:YCII-related domain-containing protein n=1 Tax=Streptomyces albipurpureus TaxID=2897419 RepID=A0ABT0UT73_9ACTN|nr:hypothetical protein [Streptomyces sp. CWNU-1]MCM2391591.1 hypothetical protein [Streptomyces sp. CWNU-1]
MLVAGDGIVSEGTYPGHKVPNGGCTVLELPSREAALERAAKTAVACRCSQEVRQFQYDQASTTRPTSARVGRASRAHGGPQGKAWSRTGRVTSTDGTSLAHSSIAAGRPLR